MLQRYAYEINFTESAILQEFKNSHWHCCEMWTPLLLEELKIWNKEVVILYSMIEPMSIWVSQVLKNLLDYDSNRSICGCSYVFTCEYIYIVSTPFTKKGMDGKKVWGLNICFVKQLLTLIMLNIIMSEKNTNAGSLIPFIGSVLSQRKVMLFLFYLLNINQLISWHHFISCSYSHTGIKLSVLLRLSLFECILKK